MAGGQAISTALGTLIAVGGGPGIALSGSASTSAAGTATLTDFVPLRSKKIGGGTASALLSGQVRTLSAGLLTAAKGATPTGLQIVMAQGVLVYGGQATISWNLGPEPNLAGYRVLHGTTPDQNYNEFRDLGVVTSYVWGGLTPGLRHYFVVQAFNTSNFFSGNSAEVSKQY